jgi:hypothetical protein
MTLVIPNVGEVVALNKYLKGEDLTLKLYSNNITPGESDTASTYTSVAGGGYTAKTLDKDSWTINSGNPSYGIYTAQDFNFSGATNSPGTIYGYYVVDGSNILRWAERFSEAVVPFSPINGSLIRVTPRFEAS